MRAVFFIIIPFVVAQYLYAAGAEDSGWATRAPLVEVLDDNSVKEVKENGVSIPIGHPAFRKLTIQKDEKNNTWIVSGTICSTNSGFLLQGAAIYAGYAGIEPFRLFAMSNLKGEVLFKVWPLHDSDAKPIVPTHLYVARDPIRTPSLKGKILRRYALRATE